MHNNFCIDGMPPDRIDPSAKILGQSLIAGEFTRIGPGAVIRDSYVRNYVVEEGAHIEDSVLMAGDPPWIEQLRTDFEGKWPIAAPPAVARISPQARVTASLLNNCAVGTRSKVARSSCWGSTIGPDSVIDDAQFDGCTGGAFVTIKGPTEVGGAWVGHHTTIDQMGCNGAHYTNDFYVVEFDEATGRLLVKDVLDIPHVSRYGLNMISSLHSGLVGPQPGGKFVTFGRAQTGWGGFGNCMWYMGKNRLDPCCWIAGWTKVVGLPCQNTFRSYEDLLTKNNSTHVLPFTVGGYDATTVSGQTLPGEMNNGELYKQRVAAWPFTYAPDAVIAMVQRVHAVTGKEIADRIVSLTLRNALHFIRYMARTRNVRVDAAAAGWAGWLGKSAATVQAHLDSGLWEFSDGQPVNWTRKDGRWTPRDASRLLAIAPDALEKRVTEDDLLACPHSALERRLGPTDQELAPTREPSFVDPRAKVSPTAYIGPGVRITGASVVEDGAWLFRTVVKDSVVRKGVRVMRSTMDRSEVANAPEIYFGSLTESKLASQVLCKGFRSLRSDLSPGCRLDPFSSVTDTVITRGAIVGGIAENVRADSNFFLVHPQGFARHVKGVPSVVEVDGKQVELQGLPMIGGGGRAFGTPEKPVQVECCFIGSNSILNAGAYIGLGCFVMEGLDEDEGLLPFTLSKGPGARNDSLATVLFQFPAIVISSIISPTFHGCDPAVRPYVAHLVTGKIREAIRAIEWMQSLRKAGKDWDDASPFAKYRNLRHYSEPQLTAGHRGFTTALHDRRWEMTYQDGELRFCGNGDWVIDDGTARWMPR